jgi:hypothetical protein
VAGERLGVPLLTETIPIENDDVHDEPPIDEKSLILWEALRLVRLLPNQSRLQKIG